MEKTSQKEFRIEKVLKRKGDKLHVKWKAYDSSFNSWIDKKESGIKMSQYLSKPFNRILVTVKSLKLICQIMQLKETLKILHTLILQVLH